MANHHFPPENSAPFGVPPPFVGSPWFPDGPCRAIQSGADLVAELARKAAPRRGALRALEALLQVLAEMLGPDTGQAFTMFQYHGNNMGLVGKLKVLISFSMFQYHGKY